MRRLRALGSIAIGGLAAALIVAALVIGTALAVGYRPVVLTTGSMAPTAPAGSLLVAAPADELNIGDIVVMRRPGRPTVTHRVVEIETGADGREFAVTRGDANSEIDPQPYPMDGPELVARWALPNAGGWLMTLGRPWIALVVVTLAVGGASLTVLRRIWSDGDQHLEATPDGGAKVDPAPSSRRRPAVRRSAGVAVAAAAFLASGGLAWSLYLGVGSVTANTFSTAECFDARVDGVQHGSLTHSTDGAQTATVASVDPTSSFLVFSVSSAATDVDGSQISGRLLDATTVEFIRHTDDITPGPIDVEWSVVTYACGVEVQRGVVNGDGGSSMDVALTPIDPSNSMVLVSSTSPADDLGYDADDQITASLLTDTVRLGASGQPIPVGAEISWQVISWTAPGDATVDRVTATLDASSTTTTVSLPGPVDLDSTFVVADVSTPGTPAGPLGARTARVRLLDPNTLEVTRLVAGTAIEVDVQVVELADGTFVQHGVLDLAPTENSDTAPLAPIDRDRTSAFTTSLYPGSPSGGATERGTADGVAVASVSVSLPTTSSVEIRRNRADDLASFAWQVVSWGGPGWGDPASPFRQRVDLTAGSVDAPGGYTTSVTIDHQAMVASGLSLASGDDLRLWRFDGSSWSELDRVLDEDSAWNESTTRLWFRAQEAVAAGTTVSYWLYYGDDAPPPPLADPDNVWLLREGFESGSLGAFEDRTGGTAWYRALPWTTRREVTIPATAVPADLTDQVVRVSIVDPALGPEVQPDGSDLRFTAADGVTPLPHDVEWFDPTTGTLHAWVRIPNLSSSIDTTVYLFHGAADAPDQRSPRATWAGPTWTFANDPAGASPTLDDLSSENLDGIALADASRVMTGDGPAVYLDGTTDRLESAPVVLDGVEWSGSVWLAATPAGSEAVLIAHGDPAISGGFELALTNAGSFRVRLGTTDGVFDLSGGTASTASTHLAFTYDGVTLTLFQDGAVVGSAPVSGSVGVGAERPILIGGDAAGTRTVDAQLLGARLEAATWTPSEVAFAAANRLDHGSTVAVGPATPGIYHDQGDWLQRRPLSVQAGKVTGVLTDYPLLVQIVVPDLAATAQVDGDDLIFTAGDGETRLDHRIEWWDPATGALTAWVRIPTLDGSVDTNLFLYSGNPSAVDQQDATGVWGAEADLVLLGS